MSTDPQSGPPQTMAQELPDTFRMPRIVRAAELRKGPVNQRTLTWMNEVQTRLDKHASCIRHNGGFFVVKFVTTSHCREIKKTTSDEEAKTTMPLKAMATYIEEDIQPAIDALLTYQETDKQHARDKAQEVIAAKKRKREEEEEREQGRNRKLNTLTKELRKVRDRADHEMGDIRVGLHRKFLKFEGMILDMMVPSDITGEDNSGDDGDDDSGDGSGDD